MSNKQVLCATLTLLLAGCATTPENISPAAEKAAAAVGRALPDAATDKHAPGMDLHGGEHPDLWSRIRRGFALPQLDSPLIARHEQWFVNNPEYMQAMTERARRYLYYIVEEVEKRKIPMEIALLPAIESAYKPYAYSRARAAGLWQFIPSTGRLYGLKSNWWYDGRRDIHESTRAALDYLEKLRDDFNGDWHLALAAYNAGEGKVMRLRENNRRRGLPTEYPHLKLRAETRNYVPKLMAMVNIVADPGKYGVQLIDIPNAPYFTRVDAGSQIDLGVVAKLTNVSVDDLQNINPGFNRWATDPNGPHHLLVPADKKDAFLEGLNNLPEKERVQWRGHEVKRGETLHEIARRLGVSVEIIRTTNGLRSNVLRVGQSLMIPVSSRPLPPVVASAARAYAGSRASAHSNGPILHRVRSGETLWSISRRYGVLVKQIIDWNLLEPGDVLRLGQRLRIWTSGGPAAAIAGDTPNG
jgi:membrane-bound lytic murein transglycosylase D